MAVAWPRAWPMLWPWPRPQALGTWPELALSRTAFRTPPRGNAAVWLDSKGHVATWLQYVATENAAVWLDSKLAYL